MEKLMKDYIESTHGVDEQLVKGLDDLKQVNKRSDLVHYLFLRGISAKENKNMSEVRYCTSNILQLTQDSNKRLYKNMQWDIPQITKEHIQFLEYGLGLSERMYKFETYKLIAFHFVVSILIFLVSYGIFKVDLSRALSYAFIFLVIDVVLLLIVRNKKANQIVKQSLEKKVKYPIIKYMDFYLSDHE